MYPGLKAYFVQCSSIVSRLQTSNPLQSPKISRFIGTSNVDVNITHDSLIELRMVIHKINKINSAIAL